ncbi:MAG: hypothetical protein ACK55Z_05945, partial [bacterium]
MPATPAGAGGLRGVARRHPCVPRQPLPGRYQRRLHAVPRAEHVLGGRRPHERARVRLCRRIH